MSASLPMSVSLRDRVLNALRYGPMTVEQVQARFDLTERAARNVYWDLRSSRLVERIEEGEVDESPRMRLTERGRARVAGR